jgi:hypothetical protein
MDTPTTKPQTETPFEKFQRLAKKIVAVPKKEADTVAKREKAKKAAVHEGAQHMKTFNVILRDGRTVSVQAESWILDSDQYTFVRPDDIEVHFFAKEDVSGIVEATPLTFESIPRPPRTPLM